MRVLVGCEESQAVCIAFRERGHEAYSCDLQPCSGGHPEWHLQMDVFEAINYRKWDLLIAFPPCTYLSSAGLFWLKKKPERMKQLEAGRDFFLALWNSNVPRLALENPAGWMNTNWRKPTQIIEPYYFGDADRKRTCLWLKRLPRLNGLVEVAENVTAFEPKPYQTLVNKKGRKINVYFANRIEHIGDSLSRSKTFPGIARAMAEQWGRLNPEP